MIVLGAGLMVIGVIVFSASFYGFFKSDDFDRIGRSFASAAVGWALIASGFIVGVVGVLEKVL